MLLQAHALSPSVKALSIPAASGSKNVERTRKLLRKNRVVCLSRGDTGNGFLKKRKVVEHICLLKAKEGLSEEEEKNMLDYLYTSQYQMCGIVAISVGRIMEQNDEAYTHALYVRFHKKEDILKFYENPFQLKVLEEYVTPFCHALINLDFESEVEDDIIPIFRKGEEFNFGVEFVLLLKFSESASSEKAEDAMSSFASMVAEFPSLIVQSTQGMNFNVSCEQYTHVIVIRFRSVEAFKIFIGSTEYKTLWKSKFQPFTRKSLAIYYSVDPVGTDIM